MIPCDNQCLVLTKHVFLHANGQRQNTNYVDEASFQTNMTGKSSKCVYHDERTAKT